MIPTRSGRDGTGRQLREGGEVAGEIRQRAGRGNHLPLEIETIAERLEGVEGKTHREHDVQHALLAAGFFWDFNLHSG